MLRKATGWVPRTIQRKVKTGKLKARPAQKPLGKGKIGSEYAFSSLDAWAQKCVTELIPKETAIAGATAEKQLDAADAPHAKRERGDVTERFRERVSNRLPVLLELSKTGIDPRRDKRRFNKHVRAVAAKHGLTFWRLKRWFKKYEARGNVGLAPKLREDEGISRYFREHPKTAQFCLSKAVGEPNLTDHDVWRALLREWAGLGEAGEPPSYRTVARYLKDKVRPDVTILAREGAREYQRIAVPTIVRDQSKILANDWLNLDHRIHDALVWNASFGVDLIEPRKMYRLWMTLVWDWGSRKIVGMMWAPTPSSRTINAAVRMAVREYGLPRNFYWDNGKDFQAVGRVLLSDDLAGILKTNSVEITTALPFNARSKPIEPFLQLFSHGFDRKWGVAYCGSRPQLCSGKCREAQKQHEAFFAGRAPNTPLPSDKDFIIAAAQFVDEYNAEGNQLLGGRSPNEVFEEQCPASSRRMVDSRALDRLFWQRDTRIVRQGGCVELNNLRYEPRDDASFSALLSKWKQEVTIARDPYDLGIAVAFDANSGEFLGELQVQELVEQTPHGRLSVDGIRAMARRRGAMLRTAQAYIKSLELSAQVNGWKSESDSLLERARGIKTGTDGREIVRAVAPGSGDQAAPRAARELPVYLGMNKPAEEDAEMFREFARPSTEETE